MAYRPKKGKERDLENLVREHHAFLRNEDLVTDRMPVIMRTQEGIIVEVFEWKSAEVIQQAHAHPEVQALWARFAEVADYVPLGQLPEAQGLFAEFTPLE